MYDKNPLEQNALDATGSVILKRDHFTLAGGSVVVLAIVCTLLSSCQQTPALASEINPVYANKIADAIYLAENSARYPYGIKSINTHGNKQYARKICLNTIRNNWNRWEKDGKRKDYIEFLGDRYCPKSADPRGHSVWASNVKGLLK